MGPVRELGLLWLLTRLHPKLGPVISRWWPEVFIYRKELEPGLLISIPSVPLCLSPAPCPDLTLKGEITSGSPSSSPLRPLVPAIVNAVSSHLGAVSSLRVGLLPHRHPPCPPAFREPPASSRPACTPSLAPAPSGRPALAGSTGRGPTAALLPGAANGGRWAGKPLPLSWGGQGMGSELRLPLIPRPYSPSREENDQILIQEKAPAASPGQPGALPSRASQRSCLQSVAPRRLVSASDLSPLTPQPLPWLRPPVQASLPEAALASPRLPRVRDWGTQPPH